MLPRRTTLAVALAVTIGVAAGTSATTVYKSVDEDGRVSYSMTPPKSAVAVERMDVKVDEPDPTAKARLDEAKEELEESTEAELARESALREANAAYARAKDELEAARAVGDDDWAGTYGPYRRLKPTYYERVREAEAAVARAAVEVEKHCRGAECPGGRTVAGADPGTVFTASGSVHQAEQGHVVVDTDGRRVASAAAPRHSVSRAEPRSREGEGEARYSETDADARAVVWDAEGRTSVREAEERHRVD